MEQVCAELVRLGGELDAVTAHVKTECNSLRDLLTLAAARSQQYRPSGGKTLSSALRWESCGLR